MVGYAPVVTGLFLQGQRRLMLWVFIASPGIVVAITLATVSIQAVKTALLNPVKNLRTE